MKTNSLFNQIFSFFVGFCVCLSVLLILAKYLGDRTGVKILYPKQYHSLLFIPNAAGNSGVETVSVENNGELLLKIKNCDAKYQFTILDSNKNEAISYNYSKDGTISIHGRNWIYDVDANKFEINP